MKTFINDINLAICVFATDTISNRALSEKMVDYTTFYALQFGQLVEKETPPIDIYNVNSIEAGLYDLCDQHDHILFVAAGVRIFDTSIIFDIKDIIEKNSNYFAAAHILAWKDSWYELHHQFVLVNVKKWIAAGSPDFGGWGDKFDELPVVEQTTYNFQNEYIPLFLEHIKFTGTYTQQQHQKQGWNFINSAARSGFDIVGWNQQIRNKFIYYYPEADSSEFLKSLHTLTVSETQNFNQKLLITECIDFLTGMKRPDIDNTILGVTGETFNTIAIPANGFNFVDVFNSNVSFEKLIIYDTNENTLNWLKSIYVSEHECPEEFKKYITKFKNTNIEFVLTDLIESPHELAAMLKGAVLINISDIFCSVFSNAFWGTAKTAPILKKFISLLPSNTTVLGKDAYGRPVNKKFN